MQQSTIDGSVSISQFPSQSESHMEDCSYSVCTSSHMAQINHSNFQESVNCIINLNIQYSPAFLTWILHFILTICHSMEILQGNNSAHLKYLRVFGKFGERKWRMKVRSIRNSPKTNHSLSTCFGFGSNQQANIRMR